MLYQCSNIALLGFTGIFNNRIRSNATFVYGAGLYAAYTKKLHMQNTLMMRNEIYLGIVPGTTIQTGAGMALFDAQNFQFFNVSIVDNTIYADDSSTVLGGGISIFSSSNVSFSLLFVSNNRVLSFYSGLRNSDATPPFINLETNLTSHCNPATSISQTSGTVLLLQRKENDLFFHHSDI